MFFGPGGGLALLDEVVPDVLGLPEVDFEGEFGDGLGDAEGGLEGSEEGPVGSVGGVALDGCAGCVEGDHGAFEALGGGEAEDGGVEGDAVGPGAGEEVGELVPVEDFGFEGSAELGVDGEVGGEREGGGNADAGLGEVVEEGAVILVDLADGGFHLGQGLVEDGGQDAFLLVAEEGCEGEGGFAEEAVDEADDLGDVGAAEGFAAGVGEGVEGFGFG